MSQSESLEAINAMAPYRVRFDYISHFYCFTTDFGVDIAINFAIDDLITSGNSYQVILINANKMKSPRDLKVKQTVYAILTQFMEEHQSALLYICETNDGKQRSRARLFRSWISAYDYNRNFLFLSTSIVDTEGVDNSAAMIIRKDNPNIVAMVAEFTEVTQLLRQKPENEI
jgi:acid stress-induced BolA-like protein IbaG/YrbA